MSRAEAKWPEANEVLENLGATLEEMRRTAKAVFPCMTEVCECFNTFGKSMLRASRSFATSLQGLQPNSAECLCEPLLSLSREMEEVGLAVSGQFEGLVVEIAQADYSEEASILRKGFSGDIQGAAKELLAAKTAQDKAFAKYEKMIKDMNAAIVAETKAKEDPANTYQLSTAQKFAEATSEAKKKAHEAVVALNEARQKSNAKLAQFETTIQGTQDRFFAFDKKALHDTYRGYTLYLSILKTVIATTQMTPEQRAKRMEMLENMAADMERGNAEAESQRSGNKYSADYLRKKVEIMLRGVEERSKAVKLLKGFAADIGAAEEALSKTLQRTSASYSNQTQYLDQKPGSNKAWKEVTALTSLIEGIHSQRAEIYNSDVASQLAGVVAQQTPLLASLREKALPLVREQADVEDESMRQQEKAPKKDSESLSPEQMEIASKRLEAAATAEERVHAILEENGKLESVHLTLVKNLLQRLFEVNVEMKVRYGEAVKAAEDKLGAIDVKTDSVERPVFKLTSEQPMLMVPDIELEVKEEAKEEGLMAQFGLPLDTEILSKFACALQQKILLQGTMYITRTHVCFKSKFNSSTLVGRDTIVTIPLKDILRIEKRTIALFFQNGIGIVMAGTEIVFGSFLKREEAIAKIESLRNTEQPPEAPKDEEVQSKPPEETPKVEKVQSKPPEETPKVEEVQSMPSEKIPTPMAAIPSAPETAPPVIAPSTTEPIECVSRESLKDRMFPEEQLKLRLFKKAVAFPGTAVEVFQTFFATGDFWTQYLTPRGDTNISISEWTPPAAGSYGTGKWGEISKRTLTYTHPVREKMPFVPSTCKCSEDWTLFCFSKQAFVVEGTVTVTGVPMSDTFVVRMRWNVTEEGSSTAVDLQYGVFFVKDTWFKGKIENNSVSEATEAVNTVWIPLAEKTWGEKKKGVDRSSIAAKLIPEEQLKLSLFKEEVEFAGTAKEVFLCFFATEDFWTKYLTPRGDTDIKITDWSPAPPAFYCAMSPEQWTESSARKLTYTHPVREKMPFVPKTCSCTEDWTIFWLSCTSFLVDCVVVVTGVPMSDVFVVKMRWTVEEAATTKVLVQYGVHFLKDSWFKGKIENNSVSEATEALNDYWIPIARKAWSEFSPDRAKLQPPASIPEPVPIPEIKQEEEKGKEKETKEVEKPEAPKLEVPVKPVPAAAGRDPLLWMLLAVVLFLLLQYYSLSSRLSALEGKLR